MQVMIAAALMAQVLAPAAQSFVPPDPAARVTVSGDSYAVAAMGCTALPVDAGLRQRLLDVAAGEWARFGFPIYDNRQHDLRTVNVPGGKPLLPDARNPVQPGIARTMARVGEMEDDRPIRAAIAGYWSVVPNAAEVLAQQNAVFALYRGSGWVQPWSAAFISYVECAAGVADPVQFERSDGHFRYVDQAIATAAGLATGANPPGVYAARDLATGLPAPGDLLCADRAPPPNYRRIADRTDTNQRNMHCDLVAKVVPGRRGYVALIGGNVINAATMTLVNIVPRKGKVPAHVESSADVAGGRPWFAILALRAGGAGRLEETPAVRGLGEGK